MLFLLILFVIIAIVMGLAGEGARHVGRRNPRGHRNEDDNDPAFPLSGSMPDDSSVLDTDSDAHRRAHTDAMHTHQAATDHFHSHSHDSHAHDSHSHDSSGGSWDSGAPSDSGHSSSSSD